MEFIIENWTSIVTVIVVVAAFVIWLVKFITSGRAEQISNLKEWLLYATSLAEKELGGGTGKLKLRYVYDMFVVKFPWLAKILSFEKFGEYVDEALEYMNRLITDNMAVQNYIVGTTESENKNEESE